MPAAATSTTSRTPRRSATPSPPRSARRSRSSPATSTSRSPRETTSASSRSARTRSDAGGNRTLVSLGDLGSEQVVEVVLRLSFPYGEIGRETGAIVALTDRDGVFGPGGAGETEPQRLTWTYADDRANDEQPRDADVDRAVGRLFAARARQEAVRRNRDGDYEGARRILDGTADASVAMPGTTRVLRELIDELGEEQVTYAAPMAEPSLKQAHFASANVLRSRDATGRSVKRG